MEDTPKSMREIVQKKFVDEVIGIAGMSFIFNFASVYDFLNFSIYVASL